VARPVGAAGAAPDYLPLAAHLPAVYAEDAGSFGQVESYLGLVDGLNRAYVGRLEELATWLSPEAIRLWPADRAADAGGDAILGRYLALYDELARWFAFTFPPSWGRGAESLARRREFLARAARTWRRRGTPRGFVDWFVFWFGVADADRPILVEHFKFGRPTGSAGEAGPDPALRATLFVPSTDQFSDFHRRREAIAFAERYAPAHVHLRVCWVRPGWSLDPVPGPGASAPDIDAYRKRVNEVLCSLVSFVDHENGIHIWECIDEGRPVDRLNVGQLPGGG
jgi:hypothetical protein